MQPKVCPDRTFNSFEQMYEVFSNAKLSGNKITLYRSIY